MRWGKTSLPPITTTAKGNTNLKEHLSEFLRNHHEVNPQSAAIQFNLVDSDYPTLFLGKNRPIACSTIV